MPTGGEPQPDDETVVLPDWVMLCRVGRTLCHNGLDAARVAANKNKTGAATLDMDGGPSCDVSFTLAAPRKGLSYLNLHWPKEQVSDGLDPYLYVRATDQDLVLFDVTVPPSEVYSILDAPPVLFVYAAGPSPSVQRLPPCTTKHPNPFLVNERTTGILRLTKDRYIVADLNVHPEGADVCVELCILNSDLKVWEIITDMSVQQPQDQSNGGQFPILWSTHVVLALTGRFLCWIDYFSGVLLCDFATDSPELHFVPFPGEEEYHDEVRVENYFPERYRSVSISEGKMCFVHIDNDFHDRLYSPGHRREIPEKNRGPPEKITAWTLNSTLEWELQHEISLHRLWAQPAYQALGIHQRLPEFPIIAADDPYVLCCMLTEKEFRGKGWMIIVDNQACLRSCTPESEFVDTNAPQDDDFPTIPIVPTVFCKYLEQPTGVTCNDDKVGTRSLKKHKHARFLSKNHKLCKVKTWNPVTGALWRR